VTEILKARVLALEFGMLAMKGEIVNEVIRSIVSRLSTLGMAEHSHLKKTTVDSICKSLSGGRCRNVVVMSGSGISEDSGIPTFRFADLLPKSKLCFAPCQLNSINSIIVIRGENGLYNNLQGYIVPYPQALFENE